MELGLGENCHRALAGDHESAEFLILRYGCDSTEEQRRRSND